jgi:hypothetical protein
MGGFYVFPHGVTDAYAISFAAPFFSQCVHRACRRCCVSSWLER